MHTNATTVAPQSKFRIAMIPGFTPKTHLHDHTCVRQQQNPPLITPPTTPQTLQTTNSKRTPIADQTPIHATIQPPHMNACMLSPSKKTTRKIQTKCAKPTLKPKQQPQLKKTPPPQLNPNPSTRELNQSQSQRPTQRAK
jgi:hypothetical protein